MIVRFLFLSLVTALHLWFASAQTIAIVEVSPENPSPRSVVTLSVSSYVFDVNTASIVWTINGKVFRSGEGEKSISFMTGDIGDRYVVRVKIDHSLGYSTEEEIVITPSSMSLVTEAPRSYVPPFFEGRSFASDGGLVRVTALPSVMENGNLLKGSSFSYLWYVNDDVVKNGNGIGKQSLDVRLDYLRETTKVKVIARSAGGVVVTKTISLSPHPIEPLFYRYNEIFGTTLLNPLQKRLELTKEMTIKLEPFFISDKEGRPASYKWLLDGFDVTPEDGLSMLLSPKENSYGIKNLLVTLNGHDKRLQKSETSMEILFDTRK